MVREFNAFGQGDEVEAFVGAVGCARELWWGGGEFQGV